MTFHSAFQRPIFIVPVAGVLVVLAIAVIWTNLRSPEPQAVVDARPAPKPVFIVVSTAPIARGQVLTGSDLSLRAVAAPNSTALDAVADATGHMALAPVGPGMPITRAAISRAAVIGMAAKIPEGYRAYAVTVSEADIAGGFLQTGDRVDLYVTLPGTLFGTRDVAGRKTDDQSKSTLLLQAIRVLAVGTKLNTDGSANTMVRTVTLALESADLSKVALAARLGAISFAIRNPLDSQAAPAGLAGLDSLMGENRAAPPPLEHKKISTNFSQGITVYSGRDRTQVQIPR